MIKNYLTRHEAYLEQLITQQHIPCNKLAEAIRYTLFPGGKRIRPLLVYLSGKLFNIPNNILDIMAAAIELIHCYSLIHDDLPAMDNDDFRRGKPSCHKAFDEATAILAGDALQGLAFDVLLTHLPHSLPADKVIRITKELAKASGIEGMISGQSLDLSELQLPDLSEERLKHIHQLKTGKLLSACINMVLIVAEPDHNAQQALIEYITILGLVFQMQDDYLDQYGATHLGKGRSSDVANQKITFTHFYNEEDLAKLIAEQYQQANKYLSYFAEEADFLKQLTEDLQQRSAGMKEKA